MGFWRGFGRVLKTIVKVGTGPAGQAAVGTFVKNPNSKKIAKTVTGIAGAIDAATDEPSPSRQVGRQGTANPQSGGSIPPSDSNDLKV